MSSAPDVRQVRAALVLSIGLSMVGMFGLQAAVSDLILHASPPSPPAITGEAKPDAMNKLMVAQREAELSRPFSVPLASLNVVASSMLLIGSFLLYGRAKSTTWWVRNAVIAKALFIALYVASHAASVRTTVRKITPAMQEWIAVSSPTQQVDAGTYSLVVLVTIVAVYAVVSLAIQALLYYRVGSEPVRGFLASGRE